MLSAARGQELGDFGGDVDIVIDRLSEPDLLEAVYEFCHRDGARMVQLIRHEWCAYYLVLSWFDGAGRPRYAVPDVCGDYVRDGRTFLTAGEIVVGRRTVRDDTANGVKYFVPAPPMEFIYYPVKKVDKLGLDERHGAHLSAIWREDPAGARARLRRFWPEVEVLACAAESGDWNAVCAPVAAGARALPDR